MGLRLLLCLRFRTRWRMSSSSPAGGVAGVSWLRPLWRVGVFVFWSVMCCGGKVERAARGYRGACAAR